MPEKDDAPKQQYEPGQEIILVLKGHTIETNDSLHIAATQVTTRSSVYALRKQIDFKAKEPYIIPDSVFGVDDVARIRGSSHRERNETSPVRSIELDNGQTVEVKGIYRPEGSMGGFKGIVLG